MSKRPPQQRLAEAVAERMWALDRASQALGMKILAVGPGTAKLQMTVRADMCNGHRTCHGGMIFTLADSAFAFACNSANKKTVAQSCTVTFIAAAREGDTLTAAAEERHRAARTGVYDVAVTDQAGRLVAVFRGHSYEIKGEVVQGPTP
ncbi:MAG: hydroxyphenylacetyl-CoA thioesterase PaaI [Pseudomonadota bacterium]